MITVEKKILLIILFFVHTKSLMAQEYVHMINSGDFSLLEIQEEAKKYFNTNKNKREYKEFKRWEYNALRIQNNYGFVDSQKGKLKELARHNKNNNEKREYEKSVGNWEDIGPHSWKKTTGWAPGVGRVTSLAIDNNNSNHIIIGTPNGGVWRTNNMGKTWQSLTEDRMNLGVYSLAIAPNDANVYYWGSKYGIIYKSVNAGISWETFATLPKQGNVVKIVIHPNKNSTVYVVNDKGRVYKKGREDKEWVILPFEDGGYDLEFHPLNPLIVYASGKNFYKSTDGGNYFSQIFGFSDGIKKIAVSKNNGNIVYVLEEKNKRFNGLYKSFDSGSSFLKISHTKNFLGYSINGDDIKGQAPRNMEIAVSPTNENEVHIGGINTWISFNGGIDFYPTSNWKYDSTLQNNIGYCHADINSMSYVHNYLFIGSDGGVFVAKNPTKIDTNYYTDLSKGLGITQVYKIGVAQDKSTTVTIGTQDNGSSVFYNKDYQWYNWLGADGMNTFVDKDNENILYGTSQFGNLWKLDKSRKSELATIIKPVNKRGNWVTPFEQDPQKKNTIYVGYDKIYKSINGGETWRAISQEFKANVDQLSIAETNSNIMFASVGRELYKTENGGIIDWKKIDVDFGHINAIAIHPKNANIIALAVTGGERIVVSINGGDTWTSYRYDLPYFSVLSLAWQNIGTGGIYAGCDYGIYFLEDGTERWTDFRGNLPYAPVNDLEINKEDGFIYAATFGRGVWRSPIKDNKIYSEDFTLESNLSIYPNPVKSKLKIKFNQLTKPEIIIYNTKGEIVYYTKEDRNILDKEIVISHLASGIYFFKVIAHNQSFIKKVIKR